MNIYEVSFGHTGMSAFHTCRVKARCSADAIAYATANWLSYWANGGPISQPTAFETSGNARVLSVDLITAEQVYTEKRASTYKMEINDV